MYDHKGISGEHLIWFHTLGEGKSFAEDKLRYILLWGLTVWQLLVRGWNPNWSWKSAKSNMKVTVETAGRMKFSNKMKETESVPVSSFAQEH